MYVALLLASIPQIVMLSISKPPSLTKISIFFTFLWIIWDILKDERLEFGPSALSRAYEHEAMKN